MGTNDTRYELSGHQGAIYDAVWDNQRSRWLTAGGDGIVAAWKEGDPSNGKALLHHDKAFFCVLALTTGLVAGTEDGELFFLDLEGEVSRWTAHKGGVFSLLAMEDGRVLTGGGDGRILCWKSGQLVGEWTWENASKIRTLVSYEDSIFIGASNGEGRLWNPDAPTPIKDCKALGQHLGGLYCAKRLVHKKAWITGGRDGHLRAWDGDGQPLLEIPAHEGAIYRMAISSEWLWTASRDKTVKCWSIRDLSPAYRWTHRNGGCRRSVNALAIGGPNNEWLLAGGDDRNGHAVKWRSLLPDNGG
jgi:WD40 repeat protein